jgi:hypothetical protein
MDHPEGVKLERKPGRFARVYFDDERLTVENLRRIAFDCGRGVLVAFERDYDDWPEAEFEFSDKSESASFVAAVKKILPDGGVVRTHPGYRSLAFANPEAFTGFIFSVARDRGEYWSAGRRRPDLVEAARTLTTLFIDREDDDDVSEPDELVADLVRALAAARTGDRPALVESVWRRAVACLKAKGTGIDPTGEGARS